MSAPGIIVGIDSMVLVYAGIVPSNHPVNEELRIRATLLIYQLFEKKADIVFPMVAVSEVLVPVPKGQKGALLAELTTRFVCRVFDLHAADLAADLWAQYKQLPKDSKYTNRLVMKVDALIVATAKAAGASDFYSHEKECRTLAELAGMAAHDLPEQKDAPDFFLWEDIRRGDVTPHQPPAKRR